MKFLAFFLCFNALFAEILLFEKLEIQKIKDEDLQGFLISEKLDGVRGIWDGQTLKTKQGREISAPLFLLEELPKFALDGELYLGINRFDEISALIRSKEPENKLWREVSFNIFDVPRACEDFKIEPCTLKNRLKILEKFLSQKKNSNFLKIIPQFEVRNKQNLNNFYQKVLKNGGEGVILRANSSKYGKEKALKIKPFEDAECKVLAYFEGKGKFKNKLGALSCQMINGKIIKIGSGFSDMERENPPKIGSVITYKFSGLTKNSLPRFPVFLRVRCEKDCIFP